MPSLTFRQRQTRKAVELAPDLEDTTTVAEIAALCALSA
jgi:hypothetical protein